MAVTSSVVKKTAISALKGNWVKAIIMGAVFVFASFVIYMAVSLFAVVLPRVAVGIVAFILFLFVDMPLLMGVLRCYWRIMWNMEDTAGAAFYYFTKRELYFRAIKLILNLFIRAAIIGFLLLIPALVLDALSSSPIYNLFGISVPAWVSNLWVASSFLKATAAVADVAIMLKYYLAAFLVIADEQMDVYEAIHKSKMLYRATAFDFLGFLLSFFGWFVLSFTVIPIIFILPYFLTSYMVHARFCVANYNKVVHQLDDGGQKYHFSAEDI